VLTLIGVGLGLLMRPLIVAVQHDLPPTSSVPAPSSARTSANWAVPSAWRSSARSSPAGGPALDPALVALLREPARILALLDAPRTAIRTAFVGFAARRGSRWRRWASSRRC
jgi:hypothetical protein